ncbi:Protein Hook 3 [Sparganum proliferum]
MDAPGNKQKMCVNLHHILNGIGNFFHQVLDQQLQSHQLPDVDAIAEDHNTDELFRLLQLVLCVAVNCENKEAHIQNILHMEESVQRTTMEAIQEVMSELSSSNPPEASFGQKPLDDEELAVRCRELEAKVCDPSNCAPPAKLKIPCAATVPTSDPVGTDSLTVGVHNKVTCA